MTSTHENGPETAAVDALHERARREMELDAVVGTLTHRLVAEMVHAQESGVIRNDDDLATTLIEYGSRIVYATPGLGSHRAKVRIRVVTLAGRYLQQFRPPPEVRFLGTEMTVDQGVVDIAWQHPDLGVFYDELKTTRHWSATHSPTTREQVERYVQSGVALHGDCFTGVRLIPMHHPQSAALATPDGSAVKYAPLSGSVLDFPSTLGVTA